MKVSDLLLALLALITGAVVLITIPHGEFLSSKAVFGVIAIAGGLTYLWKHRANLRKHRAKYDSQL